MRELELFLGGGRPRPRDSTAEATKQVLCYVMHGNAHFDAESIPEKEWLCCPILIV